MVLGSDPAFAPLLFLPLRHIWPNSVLAHWCFDVYPEVIAADGGGRGSRALVPVARAMMGAAYARCDAIVDLGPRMRERLSEYSTPATRETLVPWALTEPDATSSTADPGIRRLLFGDATLGLLYSGTLGRAHDFTSFLELARASRARNGNVIAFTFSSRGHGLQELCRNLRSEDSNVRLVPFSTEADLEARLISADIHLLSLRRDWSGLVVPSKFFGALAVGRPVLYSGPGDSDVARWIRDLGVGWNVHPDPLETVRLLEQLAGSRTQLERAQSRARSAYYAHFRKDVTLSRWDLLLRTLVQRRRQCAIPNFFSSASTKAI
jgi:glycosyltransferase involved in cell wall biosynthesis